MADTRAIVIGGGVAGLAAAHDLLRQGAQVSLYEASDRFGGQVRTLEMERDFARKAAAFFAKDLDRHSS